MSFTKSQKQMITRRAILQRELAVIEAKLGTKEKK
jgi:hypothetical protein